MTKETATRAEILPCLGEAFRHHGYEGASIVVLCKYTGLGKGSLYHFFPGGKEGMAKGRGHWRRTRSFEFKAPWSCLVLGTNRHASNAVSGESARISSRP